MKIITLSLYNRHKYAFTVLSHLAHCKNIKDYVIIPVIDYEAQTYGQNQEIITTLLHQYAKLDKLKIDQPRYHESNVGCNSNIFTCLNIGFMVSDRVIHIEDDILLSTDALEYFEWALNTYESDKSVFTVDVYNNTKVGEEIPPADEVLRSDSFKPWGWATWIDRWEGIKDRWQFSYAPRYENGQQVFAGGGWDVAMKKWLRGDRYRIYPRLSRCRNIGEVGIHTPSKDWHKAKHDNIWVQTIDNKSEFKEVQKNEKVSND